MDLYDAKRVSLLASAARTGREGGSVVQMVWLLRVPVVKARGYDWGGRRLIINRKGVHANSPRRANSRKQRKKNATGIGVSRRAGFIPTRDYVNHQCRASRREGRDRTCPTMTSQR